jgi:hypothetical protein
MDGANTFLWNVGKLLPDHIASHSRCQYCSVTAVRRSNLRNFKKYMCFCIISPTWRSRNYEKEWICQLFPRSFATGFWYNTNNAKYNEWLSRKHFCFLFVTSLIQISAWRSAVLTLVSCGVTQSKGRAIAQVVSRRLPTAAAWFRTNVRSCGICGVQSGTGTGFLRVLRLPLPIPIPPTAPHSSSIVQGCYNRPICADAQSGLILTPPQETIKNYSVSPCKFRDSTTSIHKVSNILFTTQP